MTNKPPTTEGRAPLSAGTAFVVHLTAGQLDGSDALRGRVEHVISGQSLRFGSVADLVSFMRSVVANTTQNQATVPAPTPVSASNDHQPPIGREGENS